VGVVCVAASVTLLTNATASAVSLVPLYLVGRYLGVKAGNFPRDGK
jgi:hypothetical protein